MEGYFIWSEKTGHLKGVTYSLKLPNYSADEKLSSPDLGGTHIPRVPNNSVRTRVPVGPSTHRPPSVPLTRQTRCLPPLLCVYRGHKDRGKGVYRPQKEAPSKCLRADQRCLHPSPALRPSHSLPPPPRGQLPFPGGGRGDTRTAAWEGLKGDDGMSKRLWAAALLASDCFRTAVRRDGEGEGVSL